jgi:two-component system, cell cycle sensor histidine kinase and response regulator CckA
MLSDSERKYRQLVSAINGIVWEAGAETWQTSFVSERAEEILGYPREQWLSEPTFWADHIHPDDREATLASYFEETARCRDFRLEYRMVGADGRAVWMEDHVSVEVDGTTPLVTRGVMFDITAQKEAEAIIGRLAAIVEWSDDAIVSRDRNGRITSWNTGASRLYGYQAEQVLGTPAAFLWPEDGFQEFAAHLARVNGGERIQHLETSRVTASGRKIELSLSGFPIRDASGAIVGNAAIARDITERNRMAAEALRAQKLESLSVFAAGVAHDFNNLLTVILGNSSLALRHLPDDSPAREMMAGIEAACRRGADLTLQMLEYAGSRQSSIGPVDLNAVVRESVDMLMPRFGPACDLRRQLAIDLPAVSGDRTQIRQVVMSLLTNAIDAIEEEPGRIDIRTGVVEPKTRGVAPADLEATEIHGAGVYLEVEDNGCGMDLATRARVFDPFFSTKFEGRGLGLAATLGVVRAHGGNITLTSAPDAGSTFRVVIPAAEG